MADEQTVAVVGTGDMGSAVGGALVRAGYRVVTAGDGRGALSQRLAAESVTLLKNEKGLLPLSRDLKNIAVIGPHADSAMVGFPAYTFPAAVEQLRGKAKGAGETSMAGVEGGEGNWLPPEVMAAMNAAMKAELKDVLDVDMEQFVRSSYPAVSLAEAVRRAWRGGVRRVHVHTCSLDHPAALAAYRRAGFVPVRRAIERFTDPRLTGILPAGAAPQVPLLGTDTPA